MRLGSENFPRQCLNPRRMDATILVDNENKEWRLQRKWLREMAGPRRTTKWIRGNITEAIVGFHAPDVQQEKTFQVLRTRKNNVVLGMPRLKNEDPRMNWKEKLQLGKTVQENRQARKRRMNGKTSVHRFEGSISRRTFWIVKPDEREDQGTAARRRQHC